MEANKTWILIADASRAKIFEIYKALIFKDPEVKNLKLVEEYIHADSRKKVSELVSDKSGEFGSGSFTPASSPKIHERDQFIHVLAPTLERARQENLFQELILIAPPSFMGALHKHLTPEVQKLIIKTIEKEYTQFTEKELLKHLLKLL